MFELLAFSFFNNLHINAGLVNQYVLVARKVGGGILAVELFF